ncbi:MAG: hypothetical protein PHC50_08055 [Candidatus Cloacimonetes bacterium]|nr:hypothetical protein [Candidatus Cloacimonadota bacterium]
MMNDEGMRKRMVNKSLRMVNENRENPMPKNLSLKQRAVLIGFALRSKQTKPSLFIIHHSLFIILRVYE